MITRIALAFMLSAGVIAARPNGWTRFISTKYRYSLWFPPGWQPLNPGSQRFAVINFPQSERVTGVVVPIGGALMQAGPTGQPGSIEDQIEKSELRDGVVSPSVDQTLVTGLPYGDACKTLRQIEYDHNLGDADHPIYEHWTSFYCKVNDRIFAVDLLYYRGNKDSKMLNALALDVARSLRIEK